MPAVCLQVQGDAIKCNFGAKPFVFDLQSHLAKISFQNQFNQVKKKPV